MPANNAQALAALADTLKLQLEFDGDNVCELLIDEEAIVTLTGDPEGATLRINGLVGDLEDPANPQALQTLLQANYNGQGVGEAALAMDHVTLEVFLTQTVNSASLGEEGLTPVLERFVNFLTFWRGTLAKLGGEAPLVDAPPSGAPGVVRV